MSKLHACLAASMLIFALVCFAGCGGTGIPTASVYGTITLNGEPAEGVSVKFVPSAKMRPSHDETDASGSYVAQFVKTQQGVVYGPCVVQLSIYRGNSEKNWLPKEYNQNAADNPDLNIVVPPEGIEFNYDIKYDGEIPPVE